MGHRAGRGGSSRGRSVEREFSPSISSERSTSGTFPSPISRERSTSGTFPLPISRERSTSGTFPLPISRERSTRGTLPPLTSRGRSTPGTFPSRSLAGDRLGERFPRWSLAGDRGRSMPSKLPCAVCVEGPRHLTWRAPPQGNRCLVPTLDGHPLLAPTLLQVARRTPDSRADTMRCPDPRGRSAQHLSACRCSAPWVATGPAGSPRQGAQRRSTRSRRGRCSSTARRRAAGGPSAPREKVCAAKVEPKLNPVTEPRSARHGQQRRGSVRAEEVRCRIDRIVNMANAAVEWGNA